MRLIATQVVARGHAAARRRAFRCTALPLVEVSEAERAFDDAMTGLTRAFSDRICEKIHSMSPVPVACHRYGSSIAFGCLLSGTRYITVPAAGTEPINDWRTHQPRCRYVRGLVRQYQVWAKPSLRRTDAPTPASLDGHRELPDEQQRHIPAGTYTITVADEHVWRATNMTLNDGQMQVLRRLPAGQSGIELRMQQCVLLDCNVTAKARTNQGASRRSTDR